jgi:hypothetical protein
MKKWCVITGILCIHLSAFQWAGAQYYYYSNNYYAGSIVAEAGVTAGIINSLTDLGGHKGQGKDFIKDLNWKVTRPCWGIYINGLYKDAVGLRLEIVKGSISSSDSLLKKTDPDLNGRYGRNLSFQSPVTELQLAAEIHPLFFRMYDQDEAPYWSPYFVSGIGYYWFQPQAYLNGQWHSLPPLRLEGQGLYGHPKPYKLRQLNLPLGIGIKYEAGSALHIRLEIIHRILFTDYLDDVSNSYIDPSLFSTYLSPEKQRIAMKLYSRVHELQPGYIIQAGMQRGDPTDNDAFFTMHCKIGYVIRAKKRR